MHTDLTNNMRSSILRCFRNFRSSGAPLQGVFREWLRAEASDRGPVSAFSEAERAMIDAYLGTVRSVPNANTTAAGIRLRVLWYTRPFDSLDQVQRIVHPFVTQLYQRFQRLQSVARHNPIPSGVRMRYCVVRRQARY